MSEVGVTLTVSPTQARVLVDALDLYSRIGIGQLEEIANLARDGIIRPRDDRGLEDTNLMLGDLRESMVKAKVILGHLPGGTYGIGHERVHQNVKRAYELQKQIQQAIAIHRDPKPPFAGVEYDGRTVRYTDDPNITVKVVSAAAAP